jgi:hypothetical protein
MLTNVGKKQPSKWIFSIACQTNDLISLLPILFDEQNMSPCRGAETACVVVGISAPGKTVIGHFVPFFARDFAGFATDANGRISEESNFDVVIHVRMSSLISTLNSFADHKVAQLFKLRFVLPRKLQTCATFNRPLIPLSPLCRGHVKIFRLLARRAAVAQDANSAVVRLAARNARSSRETPGHAASVPE